MENTNRESAKIIIKTLETLRWLLLPIETSLMRSISALFISRHTSQREIIPMFPSKISRERERETDHLTDRLYGACELCPEVKSYLPNIIGDAKLTRSNIDSYSVGSPSFQVPIHTRRI